MANNDGEAIDGKGQVDFITEIDLATAVAAKAFGQNLSGRFADSALVAMEVQAFQSQAGAEDFVITKGGPIKKIDGKSEQEEKRRDDFQTVLSIIADQAEQRREEWAKTQSTLANVTMTGSQWSAFSEELSGDTKLHHWLIAKMIRDGHSPEEAKRMVDEIALAAKGQSMIEDDRPADVQDAMNNVANDPKLQGYIQDANDYKTLGSDYESSKNHNGLGGVQTVSVNSRADSFTSAPDASSHHAVAIAAKYPLDAPKAAMAPAPAPTNAAGLDI